jgi:hypothetical protein
MLGSIAKYRRGGSGPHTIVSYHGGNMRKLLSTHTLIVSTTVTCTLLLGLVFALPAQGGVQPKDTYILKGNPMGGVKFEHKLHQQRAENKCERCHHPSKPEKPLKAAQEACMDCHTKPPQEGMKTGLPGAFHNPMAQAGTCIDCHKMVDAQGKKAPTKCMECHKKESV